jgi:hypothetical protein
MCCCIALVVVTIDWTKALCVPCILDDMFFGVQTALPLCGAAHNAHRFAMVQHGVICRD